MICSLCKRLGEYTCCLNASFCKNHLIIHLSDKSQVHNIKISESEVTASNSIKSILIKLDILKESIRQESSNLIERLKENSKNLIDLIEEEKSRLTKIFQINRQNLSKLSKITCRYQLETKFDSLEINNSIDKYFASFLREDKILTTKSTQKMKKMKKMKKKDTEDQISFMQNTQNLEIYNEKKNIKKNFIKDHSFAIFDIAISPKNDKIALVDMIKVIRIIKIPSNIQENVFEISFPVIDLKFTFDGKYLILFELLRLMLLNLETNEKRFISNLEYHYNFEVHSKSYILGCYKKTNKLTLIKFEKEFQVLEEISVSNINKSRLVFLNNSDEYAYSDDSKLIIRKIGHSQEFSWLCESGNILEFQVSEDNSVIVLLSSLEIFIIDKHSLNVLKSTPFKSDPKYNATQLYIIKDVFIIHNRLTLISIFDSKTCSLIEDIEIASLSIAVPNTKDSFYFSERDKIMKYNFCDSSKTPIIEFQPCSIEITKQNIAKNIIAYSNSNQAIIFDINQNKITKVLPAHDKNILSISIYEPKSILISAHDNKVTIWDYSISKSLKTFDQHLNKVEKVVISNNGLYAASCSEDSLIFYSLKKLIILKIVKIELSHSKIKFSQCDRYFICSNMSFDARVFKVPEFCTESLYFNKNGMILYSGISYDLAYFVLIDINRVAKIWDRTRKCKFADFKTLKLCEEWCGFYPEFKNHFEKYMID